MAKTLTKTPVSSPDPASEAPSEVVEVFHPNTHVCLDGAYRLYAEANQRLRCIVVDGMNYEHTHEDASGVWCYRHM